MALLSWRIASNPFLEKVVPKIQMNPAPSSPWQDLSSATWRSGYSCPGASWREAEAKWQPRNQK